MEMSCNIIILKTFSSEVIYFQVEMQSRLKPHALAKT